MTRSFVLGIDCRLYMMPVATRDPTVPKPAQDYDTAVPPANSADYTEVQTVQDVTLNLTTSTADLTNRKSNGWRQVVSALKEGSVDFSVLWQPDDTIFSDLLTLFLTQCPAAFLILDGPHTGFKLNAPNQLLGRCGETGLVTGLHADFILSDFSRNESLEEGVTADVTIEPAVGLISPEWVELAVDTS